MQSVTITKTYASLGDDKGASIEYSAPGLNLLSQSIPQNTSALAIGVAFNGNQPTGTGSVPNLVPTAGLVVLYVQSSQQITVAFYNGVTLLGTVEVAANDPFEWHANSPNANPLGTATTGQTVTEIKVTTPATLPANADLEIRALNYP